MKIVLPELGQGIDSATVAFWHIRVGDSVTRDADLVDLVTDKATFTVPAEETGVVREIYAQVGDLVLVGAPLARVEPCSEASSRMGTSPVSNTGS